MDWELGRVEFFLAPEPEAADPEAAHETPLFPRDPVGVV
jgi:hypothetical protein